MVLFGLSLTSCNFSEKERIISSVESKIKSELLDPKSYERIDTKILDTIRVSDTIENYLAMVTFDTNDKKYKVLFYPTVEESVVFLEDSTEFMRLCIRKTSIRKTSQRIDRIEIFSEEKWKHDDSLIKIAEDRLSDKNLTKLLNRINFRLRFGEECRQSEGRFAFITPFKKEDSIIWNKKENTIGTKEDKIISYNIYIRYYSMSKMGLRVIEEKKQRYWINSPHFREQ